MAGRVRGPPVRGVSIPGWSSWGWWSRSRRSLNITWALTWRQRLRNTETYIHTYINLHNLNKLFFFLYRKVYFAKKTVGDVGTL